MINRSGGLSSVLFAIPSSCSSSASSSYSNMPQRDSVERISSSSNSSNGAVFWMGKPRDDGVMPVEQTRNPSEDDHHNDKYELKIGSVVSGDAAAGKGDSIFGDKKEGMTGSTSSTAPSLTASKARLEAKIKAFASYLRTISSGFRKRGIASHSASRERMSRYLQRQSAPPEGIQDRPKLNALITQRSGSEQRTTMSWDDLCGDDDDLELSENEVMQTSSPRSRKRCRPGQLFETSDLQRLCQECDIPVAHIEHVIDVVMSSFGTTDFDVIDLEQYVPGKIVMFVGMLVFKSMDYAEDYIDLQMLPRFFQHIHDRYRSEMPFHNACHAADVLHSLFIMLWNTNLGAKISLHNQIGALLAALMHDMGHVGLTNDFLINSNHSIAQQYPTRAPMESMHIALAVEAMVDPQFHVLARMGAVEQAQVLTVVRESILATALCYQRDLLYEVNQVTSEEWNREEDCNGRAVLPQKLQVLALRLAMHVSDISQTTKTFAQHQQWVTKLEEEHFLQGDFDTQMMYGLCPDYCHRAVWTQTSFLESQVSFLKCLAAPAVTTLNHLPWMDVDQLVQGLHANIAEWEQRRQ